MAGLYFEDFEVGKVYEHEVRRTVTEYDNIMFSCMTLNTQPLHIDSNWARENGAYGKPLMNSMLTLAIIGGVGVTELTLGTTLGNLAMTDIEFPKPVFAGDTLWGRTTILSKTPSASKPDRGVVEFLHEGLNQKGEIVARMRRKGMMKTRPK
ncbi:MAG: MaoC family dehydratase [Alphaproteobacteria bacterium]|nr:MaoC family dehydratase [Alphaproteobacteria bacterium]